MNEFTPLERQMKVDTHAYQLTPPPRPSYNVQQLLHIYLKKNHYCS